MSSILLINDEWLPTSGGISVFNRELATELARQGYRVACLVLSISPAEVADARSRGVLLLAAQETPAGAELLVPVPEALRFRPDAVVGHDRISGVAAWTYARKYLSTQLVHIVHTAPSDIERYKPTGQATQRIEERERITRQIARDADIVAAVGPRLAGYSAHMG